MKRELTDAQRTRLALGAISRMQLSKTDEGPFHPAFIRVQTTLQLDHLRNLGKTEKPTNFTPRASKIN